MLSILGDLSTNAQPYYPQDDEIELFGTMVEKTLIAGTGYSAESGEKELEKGIADLIAFGAPFLAIPICRAVLPLMPH